MTATLLMTLILAAQAASTAPSANPRPVPTPGLAEPARPSLPIVAYFTDADYPEEAVHNNQQGVVGFRLTIGRDGRVAHCTITRSSRWSALDDATCRILIARARFTPAHDMQGRPTQDTVDSHIAWVMRTPA